MLAKSVGPDNLARLRKYQVLIWIITFIIYAVYHMTRKTYSVVKSPLKDPIHGWAPFSGKDGKSLLGTLDTIFLAVYAVALVAAGHIGDRSNLRLFLPVGLIGSGFGVALWYIGYVNNIHSIAFFVFANVVSGIFQATGWPAVVCLMSRWFPKGKRGIIMGVWNAHTSVGNMLGSLICASLIDKYMDGYGWPYAFLFTAVIAVAVGVLTYFFLVASPGDVGLTLPMPQIDIDDEEDESEYSESVDVGASLGRSVVVESSPIAEDIQASDHHDEDEHESIGFIQAIMIPGVLEFSFSLFFFKLVAYTFLFWLPYYLKNFYSDSTASMMSIFFDLGGIFGGIVAGLLSDIFKKPGLVSVGFTVFCIPALIGFRYISEHRTGGTAGDAIAMVVLGALVNAPYALITTAVSADLGSHPTLGNNASALATVSGIIDGMGTAGAAAQGILVALATSFKSASAKDDEENWDAVFIMLAVCSTIAALLLSRIVRNEFRGSRNDHAKKEAKKAKRRKSVSVGLLDPDHEDSNPLQSQVRSKLVSRPVSRFSHDELFTSNETLVLRDFGGDDSDDDDISLTSISHNSHATSETDDDHKKLGEILGRYTK